MEGENQLPKDILSGLERWLGSKEHLLFLKRPGFSSQHLGLVVGSSQLSVNLVSEDPTTTSGLKGVCTYVIHIQINRHIHIYVK